MKADHKAVSHQLAIAKGQLAGIQKMVDEDAYCVDISNQILACIAVLKRTNSMILATHLESCVLNCKTPEEGQAKIKEIQELISKLSS